MPAVVPTCPSFHHRQRHTVAESILEGAPCTHHCSLSHSLCVASKVIPLSARLHWHKWVFSLNSTSGLITVHEVWFRYTSLWTRPNRTTTFQMAILFALCQHLPAAVHANVSYQLVTKGLTPLICIKKELCACLSLPWPGPAICLYRPRLKDIFLSSEPIPRATRKQ